MTPSHRLVCLSGFSYDRQVYDENQMKALTTDGGRIIKCSAFGCKRNAYFYCNRNTCQRQWGKSHHRPHWEQVALWEGCRKAVCWLHFRFEYFVERENMDDELVIVNWYCTRTSCMFKRRFKTYFCYTLIILPFFLAIAYFIANSLMEIFQKYDIRIF